jgi:hypothetical protein
MFGQRNGDIGTDKDSSFFLGVRLSENKKNEVNRLIQIVLKRKKQLPLKRILDCELNVTLMALPKTTLAFGNRKRGFTII